MTARECSQGCGRKAAQRGLCRPCYDIRATAGTLPAAEGYGKPTLPDLAALGISYRQLDWWTRAGYLKPSTPATGSGSRRIFDDEELAVASRIGRLLKAGVRLDVAAQVARAPTGWLIDLAPGIRIWIDEPQPAQQEEATA